MGEINLQDFNVDELRGVTDSSGKLRGFLQPGESVASWGRVPLYYGVVASRCAPPSVQAGAGNNTLQGASRHVAFEGMDEIQVCYANKRLSSGVGEVNAGASATYACDVEYPAGTVTTITFGAATTGTVEDGGFLRSDKTKLKARIPRGATFMMSHYQACAAGVIYHGGTGLNNVTGSVPLSRETFVYGAAVANLVGTGNKPNNQNASVCFKPTLILGWTTRPSFAIAGDSKQDNAVLHDTVGDLLGLVGESQRIIGASYAHVNLAMTGEALSEALGRYTLRQVLASYCSNVISNYGRNDLSNGRTAAQIMADISTFRVLLGKPFAQHTITPVSTSTDAWATTVNQTTAVNNAARITLNDSLRFGASGIDYLVEVADSVETARNSGIWKAGYTADGTHQLQVAFKSIEADQSARFRALIG